MKFTTYQQAVEPNVMKPPAVRRTGDVNAYGAGGEGYGKMAAALGQVNKVLAQEQEDRDTADVMKARNEIMTSLTEQLYGENGLFVTGVGENAKGLIERTTAAIHKTYDEISKNYNGRVRFALQGNLNENMSNFQRIAASKEMAEQKAVEKATFDANLSTNAQQAALTWNVNGAPTMYVKNGDTLLLAYAKKEGWSGAQLGKERQSMVTNIAAAAAGAAVESEDYARADEILSRFRNEMDQDTYWKIARIVKKKQDAKDMDREVTRILGDGGVWDGKTFNLARARELVDEVYGEGATKEAGGTSAAAVDQGFSSILGQEMDNGRKGCVEAYLKGTKNVSSFCAREAANGVLYVSQLLRDARSDESVIVERYTPDMELPAGAAIIYYHDEDDAENTENAEHVVASDGRGGIYGNSSSAADYTDEDGNYIRGRGKVTHGESIEIGGGLRPTWIIRPKDGGRISAYDPEKRERLMSLLEARGKDMEAAYKKQRGEYLDSVGKAMQGAGSYSEALSILNAQDLDMDEINHLKGQAAAFYGVNRETGRAKGTGGGKAYNAGKDVELMQKMSAKLQLGEKMTTDQFIAYQNAARRLDDAGWLGEEFESLQNNRAVWSAITDDMEDPKGGWKKAFEKLVANGLDPLLATALIAKSDVLSLPYYFPEDDDVEEADEGDA